MPTSGPDPRAASAGPRRAWVGEPTPAVERRLRIGVTGHRVIADESAVAAQFARAIETLLDTPLGARRRARLTVVSALAEGADRVAARVVLGVPGAELEAALPLPRDDYRRDFGSEASRREFDGLLARARVVTELVGGPDRAAAYEAVGRHIVDRADAMIAIWDGLPSRGRGGTAEIVAYARDRGKPLVCIDPAGHRMDLEAPHDAATTRADG